MSDYTSFALVGCTGNFGTFILDELKKCPDDRITILSRRSVEVPQGVCLKIIDYSHPAELEEALKGVEVIISTVGPGGLESQVSLAQAARKAGVQLFVPSEFGNPTNGIKDESSPLFVKKKVQDSLKATGMPYLLVFNGPFADMTFSPLLGFDFAQANVTLVGAGNTPISFTTRADVSRFLVHALTTFDSSRLSNAVLRLEGDRKTLREALHLYGHSHPRSELTVMHESLEEAEKQGREGNVRKYFLASWEKREGTVGEEKELSNGLWEEWQPMGLKEVLETA